MVGGVAGHDELPAAGFQMENGRFDQDFRNN
jgi:hypothetical protein